MMMGTWQAIARDIGGRTLFLGSSEKDANEFSSKKVHTLD